MIENFTHLHVHSDNSLLDGFGTISEYINRAKELNMKALALTDHNTMTGIYHFIKECKKNNIKPIPGIEFNIAPESSLDKDKKSFDVNSPQYILDNGSHTHLTVLAKNEKGLQNLYKLVSLSYSPDRYTSVPRIDLDMLIEYNEGLIILTGCPNSELNIRLKLKQGKEAFEYLSRLKAVFKDDLYIEIMDWPYSFGYDNTLLKKICHKLDIKGVITNDVHYLKQDDASSQEILMAMSTKSKIDETPSFKGGLRPALGGNQRYFKSLDEMLEVFPWEENSEYYYSIDEIVNKISEFKLEYNSHLRPKLELPEGFNSSIEYFDFLIKEGFKRKRGNATDEVKRESIRKIKEERDVIYGNDFVDYFLVVQDYINWSVKNGYPIGTGRGCFLPNSRVLLENNKYKKIKDVTPSDKVLTHDGSYQKVDKVWIYNIHENCVRITLDNDEIIECTADHLIFDFNFGFTQAKDLNKNSIVIGPKQDLNKNDYKFIKNHHISGEIISYKNNKEKIHYENSFEKLLLDTLETSSEIKKYKIISIKNDKLILVETYHDKYILSFTDKPSSLTKEFAIQNKVNIKNINIKNISKILNNGYDKHSIKSIEKFNYNGPVYDLKVENVYNYNINGITVHNSVGGSEIAYLLDISNTDPIRFELLFERFLSDGRGAIYEIEYEDGSKEEVLVNEKFNVDGIEKYTWQLKKGDQINK